MNCCNCQRRFSRELSMAEIFGPQKIQEHGLCPTCQQKFTPLTTKNCCQGCQRQQVNGYCQDCLAWQKIYPSYLFHHEALYAYDSAMQEWFESYKFKGNYHLRHCFATDLAQCLKKHRKKLVVPIPVSQERFKQRGFNQVIGLLEAAEITYCPLLLRADQAKSQVQKNRQQRLALKQPFKLDETLLHKIKGQSILLVDDVYTTGRTLFHARDLLSPHRPTDVFTLSLAR